ncbi:YceI family protein [Acidiferrobacter sp.]|uniref:YceI family protein n=1 Tax=Acidiferrobacter sp. TaxID=1872107 RepID=UPI00263827EA|nr:YceI family protein [Acidiferrobacter sp.]
MSSPRFVTACRAALISGIVSSALIPSAHAAAYHPLTGSPAGTYRIDPAHSLAWFTIGHAGVAVVVGRFNAMSGHYTFDPKAPSRDRVAIRINAASINTNFPMRDHDLRGPDFFNVREFPAITFRSTRYAPSGAKTGLLYGRLTLHGVTRPVVFHVREIGAGRVAALPKPWGGYLSGYVATATIRRSAFGMAAYAGMIANRVHLHVNIEGVRTAR